MEYFVSTALPANLAVMSRPGLYLVNQSINQSIDGIFIAPLQNMDGGA